MASFIFIIIIFLYNSLFIVDVECVKVDPSGGRTQQTGRLVFVDLAGIHSFHSFSIAKESPIRKRKAEANRLNRRSVE